MFINICMFVKIGCIYSFSNFLSYLLDTFQWLIDVKKFQYAEYIGRGAFGTVYLVTVMETRKFVSKIVSILYM